MPEDPATDISPTETVIRGSTLLSGILISVLIAVWFVFILMTWPAVAQEMRPMPGPQVPCAKANDIIAQLGAEYGEKLTFVGVTHNGLLMELYASPEGGTWTVITIQGKGVGCVVMAGEGFEVEPSSTATAFNRISGE